VLAEDFGDGINGEGQQEKHHGAEPQNPKTP
jgi:hypothetical protein